MLHRGKQVALDVARGLAYIRIMGIIHLDLKYGPGLLAVTAFSMKPQ